MIQLGVNIDHVATIRQARRGVEPDPVRAAHEAEIGGADGITVHLREDRRHIQDHDVERLRHSVNVKLNLEMAATDEMVRIARRIKPQISMLVPEGRAEITTEGGLNVAGQLARMKRVVKRLKDGGMIVSAFIDAEAEQVEAAAAAGFDVCEVHTGPYAREHARAGGDFLNEALAAELRRVEEAGALIVQAGMRFNAGHALNYHNVQPIAGLEAVRELHIGHAIVSRAVYVGMREAVREMKRLMVEGAGYEYLERMMITNCTEFKALVRQIEADLLYVELCWKWDDEVFRRDSVKTRLVPEDLWTLIAWANSEIVFLGIGRITDPPGTGKRPNSSIPHCLELLGSDPDRSALEDRIDKARSVIDATRNKLIAHRCFNVHVQKSEPAPAAVTRGKYLRRHS